MRTQGTFGEVYEAAWELFNDPDNAPIDPVVRKNGDVWMLESGMHDGSDCDLEVDLSVFDEWFEYYNGVYPSDDDIESFEAFYAK